MLKYEGIFTLQAQGDGSVKMIVSDMTSKGVIRGCASFKEDFSEKDIPPIAFLGKGHMAFTVDQGEYAERYQGIVALQGNTMSECVQHYFEQSEQIDTSIKVEIGKVEGKWRGGAIMLQHMPEESKGDGVSNDNTNADDWRRATILQASCTKEELLSPDLNSSELLFRLFYEEGVRVYEEKPLSWECRCSAERVEGIIVGLPKEDIEHMTINGKVEMTCEFCSKTYTFEKKKLLRNISKT